MTNSTQRLHRGLAAFGLVVSITLCGCSKEEKPEPLTTYKYDPMKSTSANSGASSTVTQRAPAAIPKTSAKPTKKATARIVDDAKTYVVQIAAFTRRDNADKLLRFLADKKYPAFIKTLDHKEYGPMFLVRLHPTTDRGEADKFLALLKDKENLKPNIIIPRKD